MITAIRTELFKIRTTRMFLAMLGLAAALTLLVTVIESAQEGGRSGTIAVPSLATAAGLRAIVTNTGFGMLVATVFGTIVASGEFRHRTATDTYLDEPHRIRVLTAKTIAGAAAGAVFGLAAAVLAKVGRLAWPRSSAAVASGCWAGRLVAVQPQVCRYRRARVRAPRCQCRRAGIAGLAPRDLRGAPARPRRPLRRPARRAARFEQRTVHRNPSATNLITRSAPPSENGGAVRALSGSL
jgi:hypothetical protein